MPGLAHNNQYERHLTLAALEHCPRDYQNVSKVRAGLLRSEPPSTSLVVGILGHVGLRNLWEQRAAGTMPWVPSVALDAMDKSPEAAAEVISILKDGPAACQSLRKAIVEYAAQWAGVRDDWRPIVVAPEQEPPLPWTVLEPGFVSYPDLITETKRFPVLVVDHKTSAYKFDAEKWEWHPELLTQCLAAQQLRPGESVYYMIDFLQRPGYRGTVWSFPATPVWEFGPEKERAARRWIERGFMLKNMYETDYPEMLGTEWPQALSQCQTPYGLCKWAKRCFWGEDA